MELVAFVRGAGRRKLQMMFALSLLAGIANAVLVVVITTVAERVARAEHPGLIAWAPSASRSWSTTSPTSWRWCGRRR